MVKGWLIAAGVITATFIAGFFIYLFILMAGDYVVDEKDLVLNSATVLTNHNGDVITKIYAENREVVSIKDIPEDVRNAFVAVEDARFYKHHGLDVRAIGRALYKDILAGSKVEGGSTITQQLAKNVFLSHEKSWLRKTKEGIIAINLERKYSKDKILEMYLNQIYFGHGAYGIQSASKTYFNKDVQDLSVAEGALLAGLPKAPSHYSPIKHPEASKKRRNLVIDLMEKHDFLSPAEAVRAKGREIALEVVQEKSNPAYSTYIDMVMEEAKKKYHLSREELRQGGYKIVVPMDVKAQQLVYSSFQNATYFVGTGAAGPEGAMVLINGKTGGIIAVQGGREHVTEGLNRVEVKQQPGSAFKPVAVYAPALEEKEAKPYSLLKDEELDFNGYAPKNYNGKYKGKMSMVEAVRDSANIPAVWLLNELGVKKSKTYLEEQGMPIDDKGLGIALGGLDDGVTPLQMASAYRAFYFGGKTVDTHVISKIYDANGELVGKSKQKEKKVWSKQTAWYMTRMLQEVVKRGTGSDGEERMEIAGKTGTTNFEAVERGNTDAWFAGYTPEIVGAVWIGYDRTTKEQYLNSGSSKAVLLFKNVVNQLPSQRGLVFKKPEDVKDLEPPIEMPEINSLKAEFSAGDYGMPAIKLTWSPSSDKRLQYKIYAVNDGDEEHLDTVTGKGEYMVSAKFLFSLPDFYIAPYNPQTNQEGKPSNQVSVSLFPGLSQNGSSGEAKHVSAPAKKKDAGKAKKHSGKPKGGKGKKKSKKH
ncbi:transglycosylase domain-containing protein [Fictibacillus aquaticus]|uniref:Penicillin-binding protein n=1 Tax=Fictibacillus aquaticus TaxID=2021314 RepID=A0A235FEF7_9BACL|nr:PBP1A family penicillin-binding protein [Fictibacillus aquaticus]OYD59701.1 penicillin-binding protein [Fictibacillus aquaticus]